MEDSLIERYLFAICKHKNLERFALKALLKTSELLGIALGLRLAALRDSNPYRKPSLKAKPALSKPASGKRPPRFSPLGGTSFPKGDDPIIPPDNVSESSGSRASSRGRDKKPPTFFDLPLARSRVGRANPSPTTKRKRSARSSDPSLPYDALPTSFDISSRTWPVWVSAAPGASLRHSLAPVGSSHAEPFSESSRRNDPNPTTRRKTELGNEPDEPASKARVLTAKRPNHIWMLDITEVPALFRICSFKLAVVLDVFSRMPLAFRVFCKEPSAQQIFQLYQDAFRYGKPRHTITDQGSQFIAKIFTDGLDALDIKQRFGAIGTYGSIAIIERLWRTLKGLLLLKRLRPLDQHELEHRVRIGLDYYAYHRPHQGLAGATPAEIFFHRTPAQTEAIPPPRARLGRGPRGSPFIVEFFDPEQRLPLLVKKTA